MLRKEEHSVGEKAKMLRILSWNSNVGFDKISTSDFEPMRQEQYPAIHTCANLPLKQNHSFEIAVASSIDEHAMKAPADILAKTPFSPELPNYTSGAFNLHDPVDSSVSRSHVHLPADANDTVMESEIADLSRDSVGSKGEARLATMRQTISTQLNLEILLKHRELRLIDQELAKCQIALEQLRRCSEIPYPALLQPSENITAGKGPALRKQSERFPAPSPAPWGVTDGPYSRHYAKWLLPDPRFDGGEPELANTLADQYINGRSTRGHYTDFAQMVGKTSRSQRALNHASLPAGYGEVKQKPTGPMILKRKSDGKMVKLVCPDCGRHDFGSAQGFINHCRIGHQRNFASHDAAAEGCGEPIDVEDQALANPAPSETPTPMPTPTPTPTSVPMVAFSSSSSVHPLIRSAHLVPKTVVGKPLVANGCLSNVDRRALKAKRKSAQTSPQCPQVPHLSALVQARGVTNLQDLIDDAKRKVDLCESDMEEDEAVDLESPHLQPRGKHSRPSVAGTKQPKKSSSSSEQSSSAQSEVFSLQARDANTGPISSISTVNNDPLLHGFVGLLPSPTNESTQAPSLIDDDEEMDPQSPTSSDEIEESDVHFHVRDDEHLEEAHDLRGHEMQTPATPCIPEILPTQANATDATNYNNNLNSNKRRQPSFVRETVDTDGQNDQKRRKIGD